ncbi:hypothetical protein SAMN04487897_1446 [Paenibacillus sp. yr247]|uniref:hypothetical protein n=1 Tax=Paenibacillus sp. yr247 TaxID=1761880 RepID=UPI0008852E12|nr:hypothetical protein [Paenibacillus sp. yr247]SDP18580.1 hypothetical protein SAMN04487897_1446 [Paenibacillus sp. yr247]
MAIERKKTLTQDIVSQALDDVFKKLNPRVKIKNVGDRYCGDGPGNSIRCPWGIM